MASYTQITRNEDGEYIRETKQSPANTVYLVEYATKATYYKVENVRDSVGAEEKMYGDNQDGVESVEHPDRFDVIVDETYDNGELMENAKEKLMWRKMVEAADLSDETVLADLPD